MTSSTTTPAVTPTPVHGGLAAPVNRFADDHLYRAEWPTLPRVNVTDVDHTTMLRIGDGTLSPLEGPMTKDQYDMVLAEGAIERDGVKYAWTIPIVLPITESESRLCREGTKLALSHNGEVFGCLTVDSAWEWDKQAFIESVYGTERTDHPGAGLWTGDERKWLVGGTIRMYTPSDDRSFAERVMSPEQTRSMIGLKGYEQTIAFQTRNPLHRAHEYALVYGAEQIVKNGKRTGVILNPLVGQLKGDDVPADTRMQTYEALVDGKFLGEGDKDETVWQGAGQDLNANLELIGLDMRMYYGGPKEAVMHAIYRQNLGFSHFIIGRKHADAPYADGSAIWGDFDAQEIFQNLGGDLKIQTVNVGFAAYFEEIGRVGLVEHNKENTSVSISGSKVREQLNNGEMPDERIMRPSTAKILVDFYASKKA